MNVKLPLMEAYLTFQGEGFHQGKPAWFIRLGGCDVGCVWCDTMDSWDGSRFPLVGPAEMAASAKKSGVGITVITGGEPLMHNLGELCSELHAAGMKTHLETSGSYPLTGEWDWICFSPKKFKAPLDGIFTEADELKVVVFNSSDLDWAESFTGKVGRECKLSLQPEWSVRGKTTPMIIEHIRRYPRWNLSMQIHKYAGVR